MPLEFEPQDRGPEDAALAQIVAHPRLDRAEILTDDYCLSAVRLEGEDADHRLVVVADVRPGRRRHAVGDPPEPEQPDDVVDADPAGMAQHGREDVAHRAIGQLGEAIRPPRRLGPILAGLVEGVGGSAHRDARSEDVLQPPAVGAVRMDADGKIVHDAEHHPGPYGCPLRAGQLLVQRPLQPLVKVHQVGVRRPERLDGRRARVGQLGRPRPPVGTVRLRDGAPGGEVGEAVALAPHVRPVRRLSAAAAGHVVNQQQRRAFGRPDGVTVDAVDIAEGRLDVGSNPVDSVAIGRIEIRILRYELDPEVHRIGEPPAGGQVRRRFHRRDGLGGVQRIDQYESGAVLGGRPGCQVGEVAYIADAPGPARPHAVQLGREPPGPPIAHPLGKAQPAGCDDQCCGGLHAARAGTQRVVAERQITGDLERCLADEPTVDVSRRRPVLQLAQAGPGRAGLQVDPYLDRIPVRHVYGDRRGPTGAARDNRGEHASPGGDVLFGQGGFGGRRRRRVHAHGREHAADRLGRDENVAALPIPEFGSDSVGIGELAQRRVEVVHRLASRCQQLIGECDAQCDVRPTAGSQRARVGAVSSRDHRG